MTAPQILFEDESLLAVDKPSGLCTIPGRDGPVGASLKEILETSRGAPLWVVHRLDAGTSGVVVFARNAEEHRRLNDAFAKREVQKTYLALVAGIPRGRRGTLDWPIAPGRGGRMRVGEANEQGALASRTRVDVKWCWAARDERPSGVALIEFQPETGRTHQIRVHAAKAGWPILGDTLYDENRKGASAPRLMLHASALDLPSRRDGRVVVSAPLHSTFTEFMRALGPPIGRVDAL